MSDQGYSPAESGQEEEEDTGLFCQGCSPLGRKIGYYLTLLAGLIVFALGIIDVIGASVFFLIAGSFLILLCPLWIKSPAGLCKHFKDPLRLSSLIIFLAFLIFTIVCIAIDSDFLKYIAGIGLAISGVWYFLSYFKNGQKACIAFCKTCCQKDENSGEGETVESS